MGDEEGGSCPLEAYKEGRVQYMVPMVITVTLFTTIAYVLVTYMEHRRRSSLATLQADLQLKLLEKFGNVPELMQYLQTESGQRFLAVAPIERTNPFARILRSVQVGVILALVGPTLLALRGAIQEGEEPLLVLGAVALAVGLGFLISAAAAYVLSKNWGLLDQVRGQS